MRKITFQTDKNQNSFIFSVDHNDIIDHIFILGALRVNLCFTSYGHCSHFGNVNWTGLASYRS